MNYLQDEIDVLLQHQSKKLSEERVRVGEGEKEKNAQKFEFEKLGVF